MEYSNFEAHFVSFHRHPSI